MKRVLATLCKPVLVFFALGLLVACQPAPAIPTATPPAADSTSVPVSTLNVPSLSFEGFDMLDALSGWAWNGISQLYRTDDGGASWHEIHLQGRMLTSGAAFLSSQEAWLPGVADAGIHQSIYHTADGGRTWSALSQLPGPNLELHFHDAQIGWALNGVGAAGNVFYQVYKTTDGGVSWTQLRPKARAAEAQGPLADTIHVASGDSVSFMPPATIWITSGYGISTPYAGLTVSHDDSQTWKDINPPLPASLLGSQPPVTTQPPQFVSDIDAFLSVTAGNKLVFFASHDRGDTWTLLPPVLPAAEMHPRVQFVNLRDGFAVSDAGLRVTRDGGQSWQPISTPFPFEPAGSGPFASQFDFVDASTGWALLSRPGGGVSLLRTSDGGLTWFDLQPHLGF